MSNANYAISCFVSLDLLNYLQCKLYFFSFQPSLWPYKCYIKHHIVLKYNCFAFAAAPCRRSALSHHNLNKSMHLLLIHVSTSSYSNHLPIMVAWQSSCFLDSIGNTGSACTGTKLSRFLTQALRTWNTARKLFQNTHILK